MTKQEQRGNTRQRDLTVCTWMRARSKAIWKIINVETEKKNPLNISLYKYIKRDLKNCFISLHTVICKIIPTSAEWYETVWIAVLLSLHFKQWFPSDWLHSRVFFCFLFFTESKCYFQLHFVRINKQNWKKSGSGAYQSKEVKLESVALSRLRRCVEVEAFAREEWAARPLVINPRYYPGICQICSLPRQPSVTHSVITSERSRPLHPCLRHRSRVWWRPNGLLSLRCN